jgi:hypothetical protein
MFTNACTQDGGSAAVCDLKAPQSASCHDLLVDLTPRERGLAELERKITLATKSFGPVDFAHLRAVGLADEDIFKGSRRPLLANSPRARRGSSRGKLDQGAIAVFGQIGCCVGTCSPQIGRD